MPKPKHKADPADTETITAGFCDEGHLHVKVTDEDGDPLADIALEFDDGVQLVQELMGQLEEMTGLMFVLIDPDDIQDGGDAIGPVMGNA